MTKHVLSQQKSIPVFFPNLSNYDAHFIMQELHNIPEIEDIEVMAKTLENFVNFKVKVYESKFKLNFKDSLNFLVGSYMVLLRT